MEKIRLILFWTMIGFYFAAFFSAAYYIFFKKRPLIPVSIWTLRSGFLLDLVIFILDWINFGKFPLFKTGLSGILILIALQIVLKKDLLHIVFFSMIPILVSIFLEGASDPAAVLAVVHDTKWLVVHVIFAWFSFASFAVGTGMAIMYLVKMRRGDFLPEMYTEKVLDDNVYKLVALGVLFQFGMIASGMMWAKALYGRYWAWDPIEVSSLAVLVFFILYLHARLLLKFSAKASSWMLIIGIVLLAISLWGMNLIVPGDHMVEPDKAFTR